MAAMEREGRWRRGGVKKSQNLECWGEAQAQEEMSRILVWMAGRWNKPT